MNKNMIKAQKNKNDEFYTQYIDIEKEVSRYTECLENKIIYCNTDSVNSHFVKFFKNNFHKFKLKTLINSCIDGYAEVFDGYNSKRICIDGDFRSTDSVNILKKCDVVVSNPPFSLFREYTAQLIKYEKNFLIMGNNNAITYKEIFPLIKNNKMWLGYHSNKTMEFALPDNYDKWNKIENGVKIGKVPAISWFTNLDVEKRKEFILLSQVYEGNEGKYPKYDNYNAIEVSKVKNIPKDYGGIMGVPITFLTKYNPEQFKILGSQRWEKSKELIDVYKGNVFPAEDDKKTTINGKETYDRIFIKNKNLEI